MRAWRIVGWGEFKQRYGSALVLTQDTGFSRPYGQNPYTGYDDVDTPPFFPVKNLDDKRLPPKERVVLIERGGKPVAVPFSVLEKRRVVRVTIGGRCLTVRITGAAASELDSADIQSGRRIAAVEVVDSKGRLVPYTTSFWFAVAALRPRVALEE